jgi:predicted metal-dependent hydrolase
MTANAAPQPPHSSGSVTHAPLHVRKLLVDLSQGFARHWHGGDSFRTQYFNALSMSFPIGEQFFIDSVREAAKRLGDSAEHQALRATITDFCAQEATHRHVHSQYNQHLAAQGLVNHWQVRATRRIAKSQGFNPMHQLAATVAFEHITGVFADLTLRHDDLLAGADAPMQTLWRWHAAEETEHKSVAFDLYKALGGNYAWRVRWYGYVLLTFLLDTIAQTSNNLWRDGQLLKPGTWWSGLSFAFGLRGLAWRLVRPLAAYFKLDFHPTHEGNPALASDWLGANAASFKVIR